MSIPFFPKPLISKRFFYRITRAQIVHVLHIGKTGGTALKTALKNNRTICGYKIKLHGHDFILKDVRNGEKVVFFVRDPITRFISGFYSRQRKGRPRYDIPWSPDEEAAFRIFSTPNALAVALSSEEEGLREAAIKAMNRIFHFNSFYYWFTSKEYFLSRLPSVLFIGFQENLEEDFERLKIILGIDRAVKLPEDEISAHKNPIHCNVSLDGLANKNLAAWYARDYEFFELCKKTANQINQMP